MFKKINSIDIIPFLSKSDNKSVECVIRKEKLVRVLISKVRDIKLIIRQKHNERFISILEVILRNENEIVSIS